MPFIRHTRDKRGYETTYVMHVYRPQSGQQRTRVLYLFRSPSHVKFGRRALDEEAREALEHTHPDVSFDWTTLGRESVVARQDPPKGRDRGGERRRPQQGSPAPQRPVPVVLDDQTLLGRTLGAERAAELRARYAEILQRITRRARTPEDRDRLIERAQRLNPDDWADEDAIRTAAATVEADWAALTAELPARRRGRRGGRRQAEAETSGQPPMDAAAEGAEASGIIDADGGVHDAVAENRPDAGDAEHPGAPGDDGGLGPGTGDGTLPGDH